MANNVVFSQPPEWRPAAMPTHYLLLHDLQVPCYLRSLPPLRVPGHPQHPPLLGHEEGGEEEAEADGEQGEG